MRVKAYISVLALICVACLPLGPVPAYGGTVVQQLQVAATILDKGNCSFETPGPYAINFSPDLNPLAAVDRTASVTFSVKCTGIGNKSSTVVIDREGAGQLYLEKGSDTIPYSLNLPTSRAVTNNIPVPVTLTASISGSAYSNAPAGTYSDTIVINVAP